MEGTMKRTQHKAGQGTPLRATWQYRAGCAPALPKDTMCSSSNRSPWCFSQCRVWTKQCFWRGLHPKKLFQYHMKVENNPTNKTCREKIRYSPSRVTAFKKPELSPLPVQGPKDDEITQISNCDQEADAFHYQLTLMNTSLHTMQWQRWFLAFL